MPNMHRYTKGFKPEQDTRTIHVDGVADWDSHDQNGEDWATATPGENSTKDCSEKCGESLGEN